MTVVMEDEDFVVVKASDDSIRVEVSDVGLQGPAGIPDFDNVDHISFSASTSFSPVQGSISWNNDDYTFDMGLGGGVVLQAGQEFFMPKCLNNSGSLIPNGAFVMATGAQGDQITIAKGINDGSIAPEYMIGVAAEDIPHGSNTGRVTTNGMVRDINTSTWAVGTLLYPHSSIAGQLTSIRPSAPSSRLPIAIVLRQHTNTGRIYVRMAIGQHLRNDIDDVEITSPQEAQTIVYDSVRGIWKNSAPVVVSPNGTKYRIIVANDGTLSTVMI